MNSVVFTAAGEGLDVVSEAMLEPSKLPGFSEFKILPSELVNVLPEKPDFLDLILTFKHTIHGCQTIPLTNLILSIIIHV
jgi:hypothetical protein